MSLRHVFTDRGSYIYESFVCLQFVIVVFPDHTHYFCIMSNDRVIEIKIQ